MASQNPQEITPSPALWDAGDVPIQVPEDCTWGIPKEMMSDVLRLLDVNKIPRSESWQFSLEDFQQLISLLYLNRSDDVPINDAIAEEIAALDAGSSQQNPNPSPATIAPFNGLWILVVGTGHDSLPEKQKWVAATIAGVLASRGYGLLHGGWPGVDEIVSQEFSSMLQADNRQIFQQMRMIVIESEKPAFRHGPITYTADFEDWKAKALDDAAAVILIGGGKGTYAIYEAARYRGLPVIPVKGSGGETDTVFREMTAEESAVAYASRLLHLAAVIRIRQDADYAAQQVIYVLHEILYSKEALTKDRFIEAAQKEEAWRRVVFGDDIQKGRWGRSATSNGYQLDVSYASAARGEVKVSLNIKRLRGFPMATGWSMFYYQLGHSQQQVKTTSFQNGVATIEFNTRHACTVGVYLEDGTVLELDLNTRQGAPKSFYYTAPPDYFRELVSERVRKNKIRVKNDIQKNRWSGKKVNGGKMLNARVTSTRDDAEYDVTLEVLAQSQRQPLTGWVAFFVPFVPEIVYHEVKASTKGGIASITVEAVEEAFTVGAMTEDGTLLELDLQEVKGFPSGFYYEKRKPKIDRSSSKKSPRPKKK